MPSAVGVAYEDAACTFKPSVTNIIIGTFLFISFISNIFIKLSKYLSKNRKIITNARKCKLYLRVSIRAIFYFI